MEPLWVRFCIIDFEIFHLRTALAAGRVHGKCESPFSDASPPDEVNREFFIYFYLNFHPDCMLPLFDYLTGTSSKASLTGVQLLITRARMPKLQSAGAVHRL